MITTEPPRVSVILTAFNFSRFVGEAMESVLQQSFEDFELIAVDDGSTDGTAEILDGFRDPRVSVVHQANGGSAESMNTGFRLARGTYIALLDGDDRWRPDKLAEHVACMDAHPGADVTFCSSDWIDGVGNNMGLHSRRCRGAFSFSQLIEDYAVGSTSAVVIRRSALDRAGHCNPRWRFAKDVDLVLRIAMLRADNIQAIPQALTEYRRHGSQMSRNWEELYDELEALNLQFTAIAPAATRPALRRSRVNLSRYCAFLAYEAGDARESARLLARGFRGASGTFLSDARNWKMAVGIAAALILPSALHGGLERLAGVRIPGRQS
jgi:glycosyltransferase involved in cell wall biosynthesis